MIGTHGHACFFKTEHLTNAEILHEMVSVISRDKARIALSLFSLLDLIKQGEMVDSLCEQLYAALRKDPENDSAFYMLWTLSGANTMAD